MLACSVSVALDAYVFNAGPQDRNVQLAKHSVRRQRHLRQSGRRAAYQASTLERRWLSLTTSVCYVAADASMFDTGNRGSSCRRMPRRRPWARHGQAASHTLLGPSLTGTYYPCNRWHVARRMMGRTSSRWLWHPIRCVTTAQRGATWKAPSCVTTPCALPPSPGVWPS